MRLRIKLEAWSENEIEAEFDRMVEIGDIIGLETQPETIKQALLERIILGLKSAIQETDGVEYIVAS